MIASAPTLVWVILGVLYGIAGLVCAGTIVYHVRRMPKRGPDAGPRSITDLDLRRDA